MLHMVGRSWSAERAIHNNIMPVNLDTAKGPYETLRSWNVVDLNAWFGINGTNLFSVSDFSDLNQKRWKVCNVYIFYTLSLQKRDTQ